MPIFIIIHLKIIANTQLVMLVLLPTYFKEQSTSNMQTTALRKKDSQAPLKSGEKNHSPKVGWIKITRPSHACLASCSCQGPPIVHPLDRRVGLLGRCGSVGCHHEIRKLLGPPRDSAQWANDEHHQSQLEYERWSCYMFSTKHSRIWENPFISIPNESRSPRIFFSSPGGIHWAAGAIFVVFFPLHALPEFISLEPENDGFLKRIFVFPGLIFRFHIQIS